MPPSPELRGVLRTEPPAKAISRITVLIADDHPTFREGLKHLLESEDDLKVVGIASDGEQAVSLARELTPDVAVVDIAMPRLNGIEAIKRIKMASPGTAIVALSAYDYDSYVLPAIEAGALGYLLKTTGVSALVGTVRAVHGGQAVFDPTAHSRLVARLQRTTGKASLSGMRPQLRQREMEVLELAARGLTNRAIAGKLIISERTIQTHFRNILRRLQVSTRTEAVAKALREGLITVDDKT